MQFFIHVEHAYIFDLSIHLDNQCRECYKAEVQVVNRKVIILQVDKL